LAAGNVDVSKVRRLEGATKTGLTVIPAAREVAQHSDLSGTIFDLTLEDLDFDYLTSSGHFHLSSFYLQRGLTKHVGELFRTLKATGLTISLDTNDDPEDQWEGDVLDVSATSMSSCRTRARPNGSPARTISNPPWPRLADRVPLLVVKMGEEGALAVRGQERLPVLRSKCDSSIR